MEDLAYYLVLAFVAAHFVAMFSWSNLGLILAVHGADFFRFHQYARLGPADLYYLGVIVAQFIHRLGERKVGFNRAGHGAHAHVAGDLTRDGHCGLSCG